MSTIPTFLYEQLGEHYKSVEALRFARSVDEENLDKAEWPTPESGIGIGTLPSGKAFLVCCYEENGAPTPAIKVTQLIFFDKLVRVPLSEITPKEGAAVKREVEEKWISIRKTEEETTTTPHVRDLKWLFNMLEGEKGEETLHRTFIKA